MATQSAPPKMVTGKELAALLGESYHEVREWTNRKIIPSIRVGGRNYYSMSQVVAALRKYADDDGHEWEVVPEEQEAAANA